jgi:hypothetical protein
MARPVIIVHGYSDRGKSAAAWCKRLAAAGYNATEIHVADYLTLTNEITIKDIAEAFDRAVRLKANLGVDQPFDAIVHSTGMLVVRSWLTTYERRRDRLKHLIGLAPATFGSPLAAQGRSLLGAVFKGNHEWGPDFMEQGDLVLSQLELGSEFTWELAHKDLLVEDKNKPVYGDGVNTPYPFIFVGLQNYGKIKSLVTESKGTDGTVRWAGVGFNCRKIVMDLTVDPAAGHVERVDYRPWANVNVPLVLVPDKNHGTIFGDPSDDLAKAVADALKVDSAAAYEAWRKTYERPISDFPAATFPQLEEHWQQFVVHLVDERGDGVSDFYIDLFTRDANGKWLALDDFAPDVHAYTEDTSYRCFHANIAPFTSGDGKLTNLWLRLIASSGTELVSYFGFSSEDIKGKVLTVEEGKWAAVIELTTHLKKQVDGQEVSFFHSHTTTLVEIKMNREPMPRDEAHEATLLRLLAPPQ